MGCDIPLQPKFGGFEGSRKLNRALKKIILTASANSKIFILKLGLGYKTPTSEYERYCEEKVSGPKKTIKGQEKCGVK